VTNRKISYMQLSVTHKLFCGGEKSNERLRDKTN
jgi:hypothetical protein